MATITERINNLALRASTEFKAVRAELAVVAGRIVPIDDAVTSSTKTWSSSKVTQHVATQLANIIDSAPGALDTLKELAQALGNDSNFAGTVTTALAQRLRLDSAQNLTSGQQAQGRANLGAVAAADIGNPDTDYVATFEQGLTS